MEKKATIIMARYAGISLLILALTGTCYIALIKGPADLGHHLKEETLDGMNRSYDLAKRVGKDIDNTFHFRPRIIAGSETIIQQDVSVMELVTMTRQFSHTTTYEGVWMGSTKKLKLKGDFIGRAGYDLHQPFSIVFSADGSRVDAAMPPPRVLSVELLKVSVLEDEDGWWNNITPKEREEETNRLLVQARKVIGNTSIASEAEARFMDQLKSIVDKNSVRPVALKRISGPGVPEGINR